MVPELPEQRFVEDAVRREPFQEAAQVSGDLEGRTAFGIAQSLEVSAGRQLTGLEDLALGQREVPEPPQAGGPLPAHSPLANLAKAAGAVEQPGRRLAAGGPRDGPEEESIAPAVPRAVGLEKLPPGSAQDESAAANETGKEKRCGTRGRQRSHALARNVLTGPWRHQGSSAPQAPPGGPGRRIIAEGHALPP